MLKKSNERGLVALNYKALIIPAEKICLEPTRKSIDPSTQENLVLNKAGTSNQWTKNEQVNKGWVKNLPAKQETQESLGWENPLEEEMAIHSSSLDWRFPWTEEPGRLQSTGSQRVRHSLATKPPQQMILVQILVHFGQPPKN